LRLAQQAQGKETPAQQGDRRYSYVRETHEDRLSTPLVEVTVCFFRGSEATRGRMGPVTHFR